MPEEVASAAEEVEAAEVDAGVELAAGAAAEVDNHEQSLVQLWTCP